MSTIMCTFTATHPCTNDATIEPAIVAPYLATIYEAVNSTLHSTHEHAFVPTVTVTNNTSVPTAIQSPIDAADDSSIWSTY